MEYVEKKIEHFEKLFQAIQLITYVCIEALITIDTKCIEACSGI